MLLPGTLRCVLHVLYMLLLYALVLGARTAGKKHNFTVRVILSISALASPAAVAAWEWAGCRLAAARLPAGRSTFSRQPHTA